MAFTLTHDAGLDIAVLDLTGTVTDTDLHAASAEAIAMQKARGTLRFLVESREWDITVSSTDIYQLPTRDYAKADVDRRSRSAIVEPSNAKALEAAHFYESACRNRGWNARVFPDREAAIAWLRQR